jgi:hypothetical protein
MTLKLTSEQKAVITAIKKPNAPIIAVNSVSGSGKTSLLQGVVDELKPKNALYIAYNTAIANEATSKFPKNVTCKTTHALAYANTVKPYNLKVETFSYRSIKDKISYEIKLETASYLTGFCLSSALTVEEFAKTHATSKVIIRLVKKYLDSMQAGKIPVPHEFYLKFYHLLLANKVLVHDEFDLVALDEAGDLNPVTLAIFELLPAKKKIMVGDENQNIYSFNNTINGFEVMKDKATIMSMTKSFRVSSKIAEKIERFCQLHLNPKIQFEGIDYTDMSITTSAFISRTNSTLIGEMIKLNKQSRPYNLTRSPDQIFKLPLTLIKLKPGVFVSPEFKHLKEDADYYFQHRDSIRHEFATLFSYLLAEHPDDINLKAAVNLVTKYGSFEIIQAFEFTKKHKSKNHNHTLCTAHSSKGLEFDEVTVGDDINTTLDRFIDISMEHRTSEQQEEFRLAYVLFTRAKKVLNNARHLSTFYLQENKEQ